MPESRTHSGKALYISFILIQSLVYGIGNPLTKVAYHSITPLWLLAARFSLAFLLFALFFGRRLFSQLRKVSWTLWLPSALCCAGAYISCNLALDLTAATNVGFIMSLPVLFAPLLFSLVFRHPYAWRHLPVQLVTIVGLFLLCCNTGAFFLWPRRSPGASGRPVPGRRPGIRREGYCPNGRAFCHGSTDRRHHDPEPRRGSAFRPHLQ